MTFHQQLYWLCFFLISKAHTHIHESIVLIVVIDHWDLLKTDLGFDSPEESHHCSLREPISFPDHVVRSVSEVALSLLEVLGREHYLVTVAFKDLFSFFVQVQELDLVIVVG